MPRKTNPDRDYDVDPDVEAAFTRIYEFGQALAARITGEPFPFGPEQGLGPLTDELWFAMLRFVMHIDPDDVVLAFKRPTIASSWYYRLDPYRRALDPEIEAS